MRTLSGAADCDVRVEVFGRPPPHPPSPSPSLPSTINPSRDQATVEMASTSSQPPSRSRSPPLDNDTATTSQSTLQTPDRRVQIQTPEAPASLDDLLKSPHNPALRQREPSSTLRGASPTDHRRRSGFHLWRTESEDARKARLRRALEAAEAQANAPPSLAHRIAAPLKSLPNRLGSFVHCSLYRRVSLPDGPQSGSPLPHDHHPRLTRLGLIILTLSLAGAQLAWTLELAYGTPYLLSLGLSEQSTSLVWLAGPLSGLIAQPVVGSLSDHSTSPFRRRKYMIISATLLTISTLTLAYSIPISTLLVDLFGGGLADWDPHRHRLVHSTTQAISVIAFWVLDFALNGLQAASRALILDTAPSEQQTIANAWQGRMTHTGNVLGYMCGWLDLASWQRLRWLGGGQFRRFALISLLAMISCVSVTIACIDESPADPRLLHPPARASPCASAWRKCTQTIDDVWHAIRRLPRSVRRVCLVQLFAFMGWFPFLFYSTTYVLQIAQYERALRRHDKQDALAVQQGAGESGGHASSDHDAERGSFAMLLFALVSLVSGALLPYLALAGEDSRQATPQSETPGSEPDSPLRVSTRDADWEAQQTHHLEQTDKLSRSQRLARGVRQGLTLRTFWTLASIAFALLMLVGTAWASTVQQATLVIALVGLPWSVAAWAPFAMVGEFVREAEDGTSPFEFDGDHWSPVRTRERWVRKQRRESIRQSVGRDDGALASPTIAVEARTGFKYIDEVSGRSPVREQDARDRIRASLVECAPLPHPHDDDADSLDLDAGRADHARSTGGAGTILGIHNLAIVAPQFVVAIIASLIFSAVHSSHNKIHLVLTDPLLNLAATSTPDVANPAEGTVWVLRFGGTMALLAAAATRLVPLTLSERTKRFAPTRHDIDQDTE
ncbi:hypothetical protein L1887_58876 [Cichorium endivia]|nr:hypothetical protein L1887_58876 [Cichorium endivia]